MTKFIYRKAYPFHGKRHVSPSHISSFYLPKHGGKGKSLSTTLFSIEYGILPYQYFEL